MKPTFALDLTRDTIALLHRTPKGWLSIGEVAFDAPDLDEALDYLRKTALGLSPMGMATKIILPASQILYTEVHAPGPSREEKRRQIAAGLEGRTPYAVEDLVFDWSGKGAKVKVAVVARETLDEAEGFATTHRLNPVSFVAIPEEGTFVGEAWFGPTAAAATIVASGETVERDRDAVVILQREIPPADPAPAEPPTPAAEDVHAAASPDSVAPDSVVPESALADELPADDPLPGLEDALKADVAEDVTETVTEPVAPSIEAAPEAAAEDKADPVAQQDIDPAGTIGAKDDAEDLEASLTAALADTSGDATATDMRAADKAATNPSDRTESDGPKAQPTTPDVEEAPFAHVTDTAAFPDGDDDLPATASRGAKVDAGDDDIPPAPPSAAMVAFASRRAASASGIPRPVDGPSRSDAAGLPAGLSAGLSAGTSGGAPAGSAKLGAPASRVPPAKGFAGLVTAPSIPGTRAKPKVKPPISDGTRAPGQPPTTARSPARPGGTFGSATPSRSRPGVVFMVLVALLLLCLALIAAWSSFYLTRNSADTDVTTNVAMEAVPGVDDEMLADMQDPEGMTDPLPEAEGAPLAGGDAGVLATESQDLTSIEAEPAAINLAEEEATDLPAGTLEDTAVDLAAVAAAEAQAESDVTADVAPEAVDLAAVEPEPVAPEAAAEPVAAPVEPAPGTVVATDLAVSAPPVEDQDEIFLSSMDAPPPALDALALPVPVAVADAVPDAVMPPPAFGTVYQFDAQGLLMPTPDGILSPDGVMLIAGPPPLVPPARSEAAAAAALAAAPPAAEPSAEPAPEGVAASAADASLVTAGETAGEVAPEGVVAEETAVEPAPADPAMAGFRPRSRPEGLVPAPEDDASLAVDAATAVATVRPLPRPESVLAAASASRPAETAGLAPADLGAQGASLAAQAEAQLAAAAALEAENPSIVAISMRPAARPNDLSRAVEAAVAAAVRAPEPEAEVIEVAAAPPPDLKPEEIDELDEPEVATAAPSIPTRASVAKQATFANAINLSKLNLIGTYGTDSRRYALVRQSNGRYKKVKVGDRIDGGTVKAITETEVRYQKGGKLIALKMPKA
ncbi:hypothetical protein EI545_16480 [Tabrizicola piscis]|uniref:Translation initiation factor 2 n=1 Tax=Tabrizicola piscis TaxID=2494374 RepID=A0A3S8U9N3_9RHOB|nr:hypothetical protein [Tabrizicola piscis]AZL60280.1 hypothetical protein EI545_16480 [Tabrizicola piscis]